MGTFSAVWRTRPQARQTLVRLMTALAGAVNSVVLVRVTLLWLSPQLGHRLCVSAAP